MESRDHGVEFEADVRPRRRLTSTAEIKTRETQNRKCQRRGDPAISYRMSDQKKSGQPKNRSPVKLQSDTLLGGDVAIPLAQSAEALEDRFKQPFAEGVVFTVNQ